MEHTIETLLGDEAKYIDDNADLERACYGEPGSEGIGDRCGENITIDEVPEALRSTFEALTVEHQTAPTMEESPEWYEEDPLPDPKVYFEVSYVRYESGVFSIGLHEESPFNPSGYDFFFAPTGEYIGWRES